MRGLPAVVLAAGTGSVWGYGSGDDVPACQVAFDGRPVLWWVCRWLDAWGFGDRTIVVNQAHRSHYAYQPKGMGRFMWVAGSVPGDPLPHLLEVLPDVEGQELLVVNANALPAPVDPHDLFPLSADIAACIALGQLNPDWRTGFAVDGRPDPAQVPVAEVIEDAAPAAAAPGQFMSSLGVLVVRRASLLAACADDETQHRMTQVLAVWAAQRRLHARRYDVSSLRFATPVEMAIARADFGAWRSRVARSLGWAATDFDTTWELCKGTT